MAYFLVEKIMRGTQLEWSHNWKQYGISTCFMKHKQLPCRKTVQVEQNHPAFNSIRGENRLMFSAANMFCAAIFIAVFNFHLFE